MMINDNVNDNDM